MHQVLTKANIAQKIAQKISRGNALNKRSKLN